MEELRVIGEIDGFDRVLYKSPAQWDNFSLSVVESGKAKFEAWADQIDNIDKLNSEITGIKDRIEQFILSVEWEYGHELSYKITDIIAPAFTTDANLLEIRETLNVEDHVTNTVVPRKVPKTLPQVPLEAKRLIQIWVECTKLSGYVEEQLRRQYLIIEELWQEFHHIFDANKWAEKRQVKLIRHFVSHASCDDPAVVSLIEHDLPSALELVNGNKQVSFKRTVCNRGRWFQNNLT
ncbi:MAG TPA: hypothetical protein VMW42_13425 [Desulfatiglandales bacterium]|nr:hypothetical protein [Desulfatiglandales bacterium]